MAVDGKIGTCSACPLHGDLGPTVLNPNERNRYVESLLDVGGIKSLCTMPTSLGPLATRYR